MTMKIKTEVLAVLSALTYDGPRVRIEQKLDRKLYQDVNKVLLAVGGQWTRKAQAHVFPSDAQALLDAVILTGEVTTHKDIGFFPTSMPLARHLVSMAQVKAGDVVLEPSAGSGRIVNALLEAGADVTAVERDEKMRAALIEWSGREARLRVSACDDFLVFGDPVAPGQFDAVVMNPAFLKSGLGDHLDHVLYAYRLLKVGGTLVSVLPSGVNFRQDRRHTQFREWVQRECEGLIVDLPEGSFVESGTNVNTVAIRVRKR